MNLKDKHIDALEEIISALEDELKYIKAGSVEYESSEDLIEYLEQNIFNTLKEDLK